MSNPPMMTSAKDVYDPRWFIWTIVFLLITGISLVSYILLSDTSPADSGSVVIHRALVPKK